MRKLFSEERIYDYDTMKNAEKDITKMEAQGWIVLITHQNGSYSKVTTNHSEYPYTVRYWRGKKEDD